MKIKTRLSLITLFIGMLALITVLASMPVGALQPQNPDHEFYELAIDTSISIFVIGLALSLLTISKE